jgi:hypothetical protein
VSNVCPSKSSTESADVTERSSSRTGKLEPDPLAEDNHDDEKIDGPKALERPAEGRVREPDLKRLLRSEPTEVWMGGGGAVDVDVIECLIVGRVGTTRLGGVLAFCLCCSCSEKDSVDGVALLRVFDAAAKRCAAR